jgi:hypothetical protein
VTVRMQVQAHGRMVVAPPETMAGRPGIAAP